MSYKKLWATEDTYIVNLPGGARGGETSLRFGGVSGSEVVGLVKFDLSAISSSATVTDAQLTLTSVTGVTPSITEDFYRLVRDWTEAAATWTAATSADNWGTAGAKNTTTDYDNTSLGTIAHPTTDNTPVQVDVAIDTVQGWVDGNYNNYGLRFDGQATSTARSWHSTEGSTQNYWPFLEVWYTLPFIAYSVNSNVITGGVRPFWPPMQIGANTDGLPRYSNWYRHLWTIPEMEMANYLTLQALRGTTITEVTTTDKDTPNSSAQYTTGRVLSVSGQQQGRRVLNVRVEFLLDAS